MFTKQWVNVDAVLLLDAFLITEFKMIKKKLSKISAKKNWRQGGFWYVWYDMRWRSPKVGVPWDGYQEGQDQKLPENHSFTSVYKTVLLPQDKWLSPRTENLKEGQPCYFTWFTQGWGEWQLTSTLGQNSMRQVGIQHFPNSSTRGQCRIKTASTHEGLASWRYIVWGDHVKFSLKSRVLS